MGVDFFDCDKCGRSVCDCGDYWACEECGTRTCRPCADTFPVREYTDDDLDEDLDEDDEYPDDDGQIICPFCAGDEATDSDLLGFAIKAMRTTRDKLMKRYKAAKGKQPKEDQ